MDRYTFQDEIHKGRLLQRQEDWYSAEIKEINNPNDNKWYGGLCGTAEFLDLTPEEKANAIDVRGKV